MNRTDISREKILLVSTELLQKGDTQSLNMRTLAQLCGVSVGSIYNYFPTKAELETAVIEGMWSNLFRPQLFEVAQDIGFIQTVLVMYKSIHAEQAKCGSFFLTHRTMMGKSSREQGKSTMTQYLQHIKKALLGSLSSDKRIDTTIWTETFTQSELLALVLKSMMTEGEQNFGTLLKLLEKVLYC